MDWETYYEKFYDWEDSTQVSRLSSLTSFGAASEVAEIAIAYVDEKAASKLIKKAVAAGVQFTPEEICDLACCCDTSVMNALLNASKCRLSQDQLEGLFGAVDDDVLDRAASRSCVKLFPDDDTDTKDEAFDEPLPSMPKLGFFSKLALALGITNALHGKHYQRHLGHCTGDCVNCPPHYGYRYGRWYFGHDHVHGCEFGGNKGNGGM